MTFRSHYLRWLLLCCLGLLLLGGASHGTPVGQPLTAPVALDARTEGIDLAGHSRWWVDASGARSIEDVTAAGDELPWQLRKPGERHSLVEKTLWIRFDASVAPGSRGFLVVQDSGVDHVRLFHRSADGSWRMQEAGDRQGLPDWPLPGRVPTFELASFTAEPVRYWVRIEHEPAEFSAPLELYGFRGLIAQRETEQLVLGAYFGVVLLLALVSAANAVALRDRNFGAFAVYLGFMCAAQLVYLGVGLQYLWDDLRRWNELAGFLLPGVVAAAGLWFIKVVTEPARFSRALDLASSGLIAALLSAAALRTVVNTPASLLMVSALLGSAAVLAAALLAMAWRTGRETHIALIGLSVLPVVATLAMPLAFKLGLLSHSLLTRFGLPLGMALQMPIVFHALTLRADRRRETGLRAAALPHSDPLTGLLDRRTLARRLDAALERARNLGHSCAFLVVRLTNFEQIADELGRDAADRALVVAASLLRSAARDVDQVGRISERDLALVLEGPTTGAAALAYAQQLVAQGLQESPLLPPTLTLRFHVAVALLPDHELNAARCLQWMEEACNAMRSDPRKAIRSLNF